MVGNLFVGWHVEEDENGPKTNSLVKVLGLNLVGKHRAGSNLRTTEEQTEEPRLFYFLDIRQREKVVGLLREGGEGSHNIGLEGTERRTLNEEPSE